MTLTKNHHHHHTKPEGPQILIMSPTQPSLDSPSSLKSPRPDRDTGFPEPFNAVRNTTLPHPDADTSPGACLPHQSIGGAPAAAEHITSRRRNHLLAKHRRTISSGKISPIAEALRGTVAVAMPPDEDHRVEEESRRPRTGDSDQASPRTPSSSANRGSGSFEEMVRGQEHNSPPTSFEGDDLPDKKRGLFGKWRKGGAKD